MKDIYNLITDYFSEQESILAAKNLLQAYESQRSTEGTSSGNKLNQEASEGLAKALRYRVGNLSTLTEEDCPGLGGVFVQIWDTELDVVHARVYADSSHQAYKNAEKIIDHLNRANEP